MAAGGNVDTKPYAQGPLMTQPHPYRTLALIAYSGIQWLLQRNLAETVYIVAIIMTPG